MTEQAIRDLGTGLGGVPHLRELSEWCWSQAEHTGDARFCGIARCLEVLAVDWDEAGGFSAELAQNLRSAFARHVDGILDAESPSEGASIARLLRDEVGAALRTST